MHRAQVKTSGAGRPRLCSKCGREVVLLPGAGRWTHKVEDAK
jgi:hypothetical protein